MGSEQNKVMFRRFYDEVFNKGNLAVADQLFASDYRSHTYPPSFPAGPGGVKALVGPIRSAFPDAQITIDDQIAEADKVVYLLTFRGTHEKAFMGIPPTGKRVTLHGIDVVRLEGGKAVEQWGGGRLQGLMQKLGIIPPGGEDLPA